MEKQSELLTALNHGANKNQATHAQAYESCMTCAHMISSSKLDCQTCENFSNWTMQHDMSFTD